MRISWLAFFLLCACAKPNYVTSNTSGDGGFQTKPSKCEAQFAAQNCVSLAWEKMPSETETGSFVFKVFHANALDGSPVVEDLPGDLAVVLWMPSMGHGSSPVKVQRLDVGTYRATQVFFPMKGVWEIRFQLKDRNDVKDQAVLTLSL
jgi:hypothetical protein